MEDKLILPQPIDYPLESEEDILQPIDPLTLDLDDEQLVRVANTNREESRRFFKQKYNLS